MWLNIVNWFSNQSNSGLVIMFAIPVVFFTLKLIYARFKKPEEVKPHPSDWIGQLEYQLKKFEKHNQKIEEMGVDFEYIRENIDLTQKVSKKK